MQLIFNYLQLLIFSHLVQADLSQSLGVGIMERKFKTLGLGSRHFGGEVLYLKWSATEWIGNVLSGLIPQSHLFGEINFSNSESAHELGFSALGSGVFTSIYLLL